MNSPHLFIPEYEENGLRPVRVKHYLVDKNGKEIPGFDKTIIFSKIINKG
jgi:hypothetical protein